MRRLAGPERLQIGNISCPPEFSQLAGKVLLQWLIEDGVPGHIVHKAVGPATAISSRPGAGEHGAGIGTLLYRRLPRSCGAALRGSQEKAPELNPLRTQ